MCASLQYAGINIGPVHKKDVMKASTMLEHDPQYVPNSGFIYWLVTGWGELEVSFLRVQVRGDPGV